MPDDILKPADQFVTAKGGNLELVSAGGEILAEIPVPAGRHRVGTYLALVEAGQALRLGEGFVLFPARNLAAVTVYPDDVNRQSDANPDWRPTQQTDAEKRMRALLFRKREASTRNERRAAAQKALDERRAEAARVAEEAAAQAAADDAARLSAAEAAKARAGGVTVVE